MRFSALLALGLLISAPATGAEILNFPTLKPKSTPVQQSPRPAGIAIDCKEWTDSCRVCALDDKGAPACSNVGIACMPAKWRCARP